MICNFCGSTIDDNEFECPYCGHKTGLEPQVVTYDYDDDDDDDMDMRDDYSGSNSDYDDTDDYEEDNYSSKSKLNMNLLKKSSSPKNRSSSRSNNRSGFESNSKNLGQLPFIIGIGVCALLSIINLVSVVSIKSSIEDLEQSMLMQFYQLQSLNSEVSSQVSALGGDISSVSTAVTQSNESRNITITRQPSSDAVYLGRGSDDDVSQNSPIFYAEADGAISSVDWQIKVGDEWVTISWDGNSNNEVYGLHVYNDIGPSHTKSQLCSHNVTQAGFATYRCVFTDSYGSKSTDPVTLSEKSK